MTGVGNHERTRMYPGVSGRRPDKVVARRGIEVERLEWWRSLTPAKQLAELDRRLGKGVGARKQRARLQRLIEGKPPVEAQEPESPSQEEQKPKMKAKERRKVQRRSKKD